MKKRFSASFRIWHLLNFVAVSGLVFTGFARLTFLNKHSVAEIIMGKLTEWQIELPEENAVAIAKAIRNVVWEWHYLFAAVLGAVIVIRIILMLNGTVTPPLLKLKRSKNAEVMFKHIIHQLICLIIIIMALTGAIYYFHEALSVAKESVKWAKELHQWLFVPFVSLIALHIAGVVKYEISSKNPIVSKMIHGD